MQVPVFYRQRDKVKHSRRKCYTQHFCRIKIVTTTAVYNHILKKKTIMSYKDHIRCGYILHFRNFDWGKLSLWCFGITGKFTTSQKSESIKKNYICFNTVEENCCNSLKRKGRIMKEKSGMFEKQIQMYRLSTVVTLRLILTLKSFYSF